MNLPSEVSQEPWEAAGDRLLLQEKAATRACHELAAARRELPMVRIAGDVWRRLHDDYDKEPA